MSDFWYAAIQVGIMAGVTMLLRFLPFMIWSKEKKTPKYISYLGTVLPAAIMGMLVVYCLKNIEFSGIAGWVPALIASGTVVGLHVWKRQSLLSILGGTVVYMVLINYL